MSGSIAIDSPLASQAMDRGLGNSSASPQVVAIARCIMAKRYAYQYELAKGVNNKRAIRAGNLAFLRAMPPLSGFDNIRNFIGCVAHALVTGVLVPKEAVPLLAGAKAALHPVSHDTELSLPGAA